jgi:hypothetical protein
MCRGHCHVRIRRGPLTALTGLTPSREGYDVAMSEPTSPSPSSESTDTSGTDTGDGTADASDDRLIPDEMLPDDLNPEKNPLAAEPDEDAETGFSPNGPDAAAGAPGG